jgi:hypothetical protein
MATYRLPVLNHNCSSVTAAGPRVGDKAPAADSGTAPARPFRLLLQRVCRLSALVVLMTSCARSVLSLSLNGHDMLSMVSQGTQGAQLPLPRHPPLPWRLWGLGVGGP